MCAAPDRVAHCNSLLQFSFPKEISISQICLINQYVKNRKLWDNPYAHSCWALKSSINFLSTFSCLHCGAKWIKQAKICGNRDVPLYNITHTVYQRKIVPLLQSWHWNDIVILTICLSPLDVDECSVVNGGCQQRGINTLGTFHCECDTGSRLHADERTCISE